MQASFVSDCAVIVSSSVIHAVGPTTGSNEGAIGVKVSSGGGHLRADACTILATSGGGSHEAVGIQVNGTSSNSFRCDLANTRVEGIQPDNEDDRFDIKAQSFSEVTLFGTVPIGPKTSISTGASITTPPLGWSQLIDKDSSYTVKEEENGALFTNNGATGEVTFTLPAPGKDLRYGFYAAAENETLKVQSEDLGQLIVYDEVSAKSVAYADDGKRTGHV